MSFSRLIEQFKPNSYQITLRLDKNNLSFKGSVKIAGNKVGQSSHIILHAKDLKINEVKINEVEAEFKPREKNDELVINCDAKINDEVSLEIDFSGLITKHMHGLYPCYSKAGDVILATQFESHHAREVFPCVDEPEAKATFDLTLITDQAETVLGNMPVESQKIAKQKLVTTFKRSPIMSTYLLAFVVGKLHKVTAKTNNGTEVNVWASQDHDKKVLNFALEVGVKVTEFFNEYFDTPYPLPKCDHVALPDFSSGAMENWGLITYREVCLIVDPEKTSRAVQEYAAMVIAHELSHQWFGNLVTMKWWDDLWLNESFATLMEYIAIDNIYRSWNIMLTFAAHEALSAFRRDSLSGVQPVKATVNHPDEISTLFDPSIVYAKGARLLFMAYNIVGEKAFKLGLKNYFAKYAYDNTKGSDLWHELSEASGIDMENIMDEWISKPGFPLLKVGENNNEILLDQQKFQSIDEPLSNEKWPIPVFASQNLANVILNDEMAVEKDGDNLILFNTLGGHYSVKYSSSAYDKEIRRKIANNELNETQKLLYINDLGLQARAGVGSLVDFFKALSAYKNEASEPIWSVISVSLSDARRLIEGDEKAEKQMKALTFKLIQSQYDRLGWQKVKSEPSNDTKLRELILSLAVYSEEKSVIAKAMEIYQNTVLDELPSDIRGIVLATAVKFGDESYFDNLVNSYPAQTNSEIQQDIGGALTSTRQPKQANIILSKLTDQTWIKLQDVDRFVINLLANRWVRQEAWGWLTSNWSWIEENFATDKSYDNYPRYAASAFNNQEWLDNYIAFFEPKKDIVTLKRNIELGKVEISNRVKWATRDQQKLLAWLNKT